MARLGDGVSDVVELLDEAVELGVVDVDRQVALLRGAQFGLQVERALQLVIKEEALDGVPQREGGGAWPTNDVEDGLGDSGEDPVTMQESTIRHSPSRSSDGVGDRTWLSRLSLPTAESKKQRHWP